MQYFRLIDGSTRSPVRKIAQPTWPRSEVQPSLRISAMTEPMEEMDLLRTCPIIYANVKTRTSNAGRYSDSACEFLSLLRRRRVQPPNSRMEKGFVCICRSYTVSYPHIASNRTWRVSTLSQGLNPAGTAWVTIQGSMTESNAPLSRSTPRLLPLVYPSAYARLSCRLLP